jgi:general secretion pathway protein D
MNRAGFFPSLKVFSLPVFALLLLLGCVGFVPSLHAQSAGKFYSRGQAAEAAEKWNLAYENYEKANAKKPGDLRYKTALARVRVPAGAEHLTAARKLEQSGDDQGALMELLRAGEIDPSNEAVTQEMAAIHLRQQQQAAQKLQPLAPQASQQQMIDSFGAPVELKPVSSEPLTLRMTEDAKTIYQSIGRAAGVNVLFDSNYNSKRIQVDLTNVSLLDALRIVQIQSNTFWRAITPNTIFVAENTPTRRRELDEQAVQTFYLTNAWKDTDLTDATTAVRNVLGANVHAYSVASQNAIIVRGTPDELMLAQKLINDIDKAMPEVVVDIAIMEVSKDWERTLGISWPQSVGVALQPPTSTSSSTTSTTSTTGSTTTSGLTLYNLANLNSNDFAVTMGTATANLLLNDSNTKILQSPRLRATNMQKATMKIGEKIPIATGTFSSGASTSILAGYAQTQFQYIDVGVSVEMTPTIHPDGDVTLKLKLEDTSEGSSVTISGVTEPIIIQKTSEQVIRLREGEVSILGGILEKSDSTSWSGIPGLSSIPILRYLFGSKDHTIDTDELVFMLVPHIVRAAEISASNLRVVDTGVGASVQLRRLPVEGTAASFTPVVQTGVATTTVGTYMAPSAASAAPVALADMRRAADAPMPPQPVAIPPRPATNPAPAPAQPAAAAPNSAPSGGLRFLLSGPGPVASGSAFQVPVVVSGAADIASVPLEIQYDATKLALTGVAPGDFLVRDGQAVKPEFHESSPGDVTVAGARSAGAPGVSGAGVVYVLTFQAKAAGSSAISITRPTALNSKQQPVPASAAALTVIVK